MNPTQRMVMNTAATYVRSLLTAGLALFSTRWVLNALGQTDFGLFSLIGSIIIFITILNTIMAGSAARHYAYAIGQGKPDEVNRWFNSAFSIHLCLAVILILIGWPIGEYVIAHILTIPPDRVAACLWVFRVTLVSAFTAMISIPFIAMFTAKQNIVELAVWGTFNAILTFALAWYLTQVSGDRLLFYAVGMVAILASIQIAQILRAMSVFDECRLAIKRWFNKQRSKEIISFAGWTLFGGLGAMLRDQGSAILLNLYFGPKVNAAYGIATQVSSAANMLTNSMANAFAPELTASEGRGDRTRMLSLAQRTNKLGTLLVLVFAIPLMVEMDYVLKLWLINPPMHAAIFCRLLLGMWLIDRLTMGNMLAVSAHGKIAAYQATLGTLSILTLPLAWILIRSGFPPASVGVAFIITILGISLGRVFWMKRLLGVPVRQWLRKVIIPCGLVALTAVAGVMALQYCFGGTFTGFAVSITGSVLLALAASWLLALDGREKEFIRVNTEKMIKKMRNIL